jgi:phage gpG-like protein
MISFQLKVVNANKVSFAFGSLASAVQDWRKYIWPGIRKDAIRPWLRKQFESQGRGAHGRWPALSSSYARRKALLYPNKKILEASGDLKNDLLSDANEGETTPRTMLYGTKIKYAIYHQTGAKFRKRRGSLPARRIFDPEPNDAPGTMKQMIRVSVARSVSNYARRLGFAIGATDAETASILGRKAMLTGMRGEGPSLEGGE